MSKEVNGYGAYVPFHVLSCTDITSSDKLVYAVVNGLSSEKGWCWASNETIAKKVCLKKDSVSKIISKLVEKNFIKRREIRNEKGEVIERRLSTNHITPPTLPDFNEDPIGSKSYTSSTELRVSVEDELEVSKNIKKENIKRKSSANEFVPPTVDEVKQYFLEKGYSPSKGEQAFNYYNSNDWKDKNNKQVMNWKMKMQLWFKPEDKIDVSKLKFEVENPEQYEGFNKYRHYNEDVLKQLVDGIWHYQTRPIGFKKG
jgi:DNA-binding Lrp family transcriptional regulator